MDYNWYTSVAGVVAATMIGVGILKRSLGNVPYANTIPTWLYAVGLSGTLTYVANRIWGTLPGDLVQNMMQAVMLAGTASGFYEWLNKPSKPLAESAIKAGVEVQTKNAPNRIDVRELKADVVKSKLLMLAFAILLTGACATAGPRHVATVTVVSAHATLAAIQDTEMLLACGKPSAPAPPACVPEAAHKEISAKLAEAFEADADLARTVRDWPLTEAPPSSIGELLGRIAVIVNYVVERLPNGALKAKLLTTIGGGR